jgi:hypothetical protein
MRFGFMIFVFIFALVAWKFVEQQARIAHEDVQMRKPPPMNIALEKVEARTYLDHVRDAMHMQQLLPNSMLESAAQAHANYLLLNNISSHNETEGLHSFTGVIPADRAFHAGYLSSHVSENLSTKNPSAESSMDGLFSAIYHRFGFLSPDIDEIGIGIAQDQNNSDKSAFVYLMGNAPLNTLCDSKDFSGNGEYVYQVCSDKAFRIKKTLFNAALNEIRRDNPKIIFYPYEEQQNIVPAFYTEDPDPLPDYEVSGFPISVEFNDYFFDNVKLLSFRLYKQDKEITDVRLMDEHNDPNQKLQANQYALFPLKRLEYDTRYRVEIIYRSNQKTETLVWNFQTQKFQQPLHIITQQEETLNLENTQEQIIYFRPLSTSELLFNFKFPRSVDVDFIDYNTIKLRFRSDAIKTFDIVADNRRLHVNVK